MNRARSGGVPAAGHGRFEREDDGDGAPRRSRALARVSNRTCFSVAWRVRFGAKSVPRAFKTRGVRWRRWLMGSGAGGRVCFADMF